MKKTARILALLLVLVMAVALFAGCGKPGGSASSKPPASSGSQEMPPAEEKTPEPDIETPPEEDDGGIHVGKLPIVDEPEELTVWHTINPQALRYINSYSDNSVIKKADEITNVTLVCTSIAGNLARDQFPIMIGSGEYTDLLHSITNMYAGGIDAAINDGIIIDLAPMLEKWCPNYLEALNSNPKYIKNVTTDTGKIGVFSMLSIGNSEDAGYMIRADWAKELGFDPAKIKTYDQWHEFLSAAKTKYGEAYMYVNPLGLGNRQTLTDGYGISAVFSPMEGQVPFQIVDGVVSCSYTSEALKNYVTMMHQWYNEGLLWKDFPSGGEVMTAKDTPCYTEFLNDKVGLMMLEMGNLQNQESTSGEMIELMAVSNPVLEEGQTTHIATAEVAPQPKWSISTDCENPELACAYINFWFTDEGYDIANYGIEGEAYTMVDGKRQWTDLIINNPDNIDMKALSTIYLLDDHPFLVDAHRFDSLYTPEQLACSDIWLSNRDGAWKYPSGVTLTIEENDQYAKIWGDIYTFAAESIPGFITGGKSLDEWDSYVARLEELGVATLVEIRQAGYDRFLER